MKIAFLFIVCLIVFVRPVWGIPILIIVTSTLFQLSHYMVIPLPVGYLEATESIIVVLCLRLFFDRKLQRNSNLMLQTCTNTLEQEMMVKRVLLSAIIPYVVWQSITIFIGVVSSEGTEHVRYGIRYFLNSITPWLLIWAIWQLRYYKDKILYYIALITIVTAIVHIVIQATDYRAIMPLAYWGNPSAEYLHQYENRLSKLIYDVYMRVLPQGTILILFFSVYYFSKYIIGIYRQKLFIILSIICFMALAITLTRSLLFSVLWGFLIAVILAAYYRLYDFTRIFRVFNILMLLFFVIGIYSATINPSFLNLWQERVDTLITGVDAKVFSPENPSRGLDNLASIDAIKDSPFLGTGSPRHQHQYSYRLGPPTDIHPLLQIGLVGGIPAILLFLRLLYLIIRKIGLPALGDSERIVRILPFTAILIMTALIVNTIGAGGTTSGNGLIAMTLIIGMLAVYYPFDATETKVHEE